MNLNQLVELSGVSDSATFQTFDSAVPMNRADGSYPFNGDAISVYSKGACFPEIMPYSVLRGMVLSRAENGEIDISFDDYISLLECNGIIDTDTKNAICRHASKMISKIIDARRTRMTCKNGATMVA